MAIYSHIDYTGAFPNKCSGNWTIIINNKEIELIDSLKSSPMNTAGVYTRWSFGGDYEEIWEDYKDGLEFGEWIQSEKFKDLKESFFNSDVELQLTEWREIYKALQEHDWRHDSCGGCI